MAQLLVRTTEPEWLPAGSRADVVRADPGQQPPEPVGLARLVVTHHDAILAVARRHGSGLDIPTRRVEGPVGRSLRGLVAEVLGPAPEVSLLGWVHNHVPAPAPDYAWPAPDAYFAVWHCEATSGAAQVGQWLGPAEAAIELCGRHWWPLVAPSAPRNGVPS